MKSTSWKKILLVGFVVILLVAIPLTLYILKQQQDIRSKATPATTLSFTPTSSTSSPVTDNVGDTIPLDVNIDPGTNSVNSLILDIQYDPTKLSASDSAFTPNTTSFPTITSPLSITPGHIQISLSTGFDTTQAIIAPTKVGTVTFTALAPTDPGNPTSVTFTTNSSATSIAGPPKSNDQFNENVISTKQPAFITINGSATITSTPIPTGTTPIVTTTPTPTSALPTVPVVATATPLPTGTSLTPTNTPFPTSSTLIPTDTPTQIAIATTTIIPSATLADTGSTDVTFSIGAVLTAVMVIGGIIFFVL